MATVFTSAGAASMCSQNPVAAWQARREAIAPAPLQTPAPPPTSAPLHTPEPTPESASAPDGAATDDGLPGPSGQEPAESSPLAVKVTASVKPKAALLADLSEYLQ